MSIISVEIESHIPIMDDLSVFDSMFDKIGQYMEISLKRNFSEGGRPSTWPRKKKDGQPSHLYLSGALFNTIGYQFGEDFAEAGAMSILPYSFIHQFGGFSGLGHRSYIPPREYVLFQEQDIDYIVKLFGDQVMAFFGASGEEIML
jgi:phage gpG-like protein